MRKEQKKKKKKKGQTKNSKVVGMRTLYPRDTKWVLSFEFPESYLIEQKTYKKRPESRAAETPSV